MSVIAPASGKKLNATTKAQSSSSSDMSEGVYHAFNVAGAHSGVIIKELCGNLLSSTWMATIFTF
jgi:hypothetical protein